MRKFGIEVGQQSTAREDLGVIIQGAERGKKEIEMVVNKAGGGRGERGDGVVCSGS